MIGTMNRRQHQPVVILGAGRSGTNLLRDGLTRFGSVATWPCDEVNYLWRTGSAKHPTDEFTAEMATAAVRNDIRSGFEWVARRKAADWVVEKTCANTLRVGFVDRVLPDAKFIHLTRDGYDVTASAMKRWTAPLEIKYLAKKARFVPSSDLPYYASRYLTGHVRRLMTKDRALSTWGPRFEGLAELRRDKPLAVVCAAQWKRCVEAAEEGLGQIDPQRVYTLSYEQLIAHPSQELASIARFLGIAPDEHVLAAFQGSIRGGSVGAGLRSLKPAEIEAIQPLIESVRRPRGVAA